MGQLTGSGSLGVMKMNPSRSSDLLIPAPLAKAESKFSGFRWIAPFLSNPFSFSFFHRGKMSRLYNSSLKWVNTGDYERFSGDVSRVTEWNFMEAREGYEHEHTYTSRAPSTRMKTVVLCHHLEIIDPLEHYPLLFVPLCKRRQASNGMKEYWYNVFSSHYRESDDDWGRSTKSEWKMRHKQWKLWCKVGYGPIGNFFSVKLFSGSGLCRGEDEYGTKDLKLVGKYLYANDALATRSPLNLFSDFDQNIFRLVSGAWWLYFKRLARMAELTTPSLSHRRLSIEDFSRNGSPSYIAQTSLVRVSH